MLPSRSGYFVEPAGSPDVGAPQRDAVILTPDQRLRVFVSSTLDLADERGAVRRAIESLNLAPVMFEAGARAHPPRALYRAYVEQSDVFVAIYAQRYGWTAPGMDVSGLEDEYNLSTGMPRLVYIQTGVEREPQLDAFLDRVANDGLSYRPFSSTDELEAVVKDDLVVLLTERFHTNGEPEPTAPRARAPLPHAPTRFVGREEEVADLAALLTDETVRLVTLVGPGGIGKTRLAVETAGRVAPRFADGVFFVPVASLREPDLLGDTIAAALAVPVTGAEPAIEAVKDFLAERNALLVLDNFERVTTAAATVAEMISASPRLKVVVTSRAPLRIRGEHEVDVQPLRLPSAAVPRERLREFSAVELFVESARAVRPTFELDDDSAAAVLEICRRLDALPLAIELAAAMVRLLTPQMLLDRLDERLVELGAGLRDMPERHQTLHATIAWSYDLLDTAARELFAQLSVFRGGFDLDTAAEICEVDTDVFTGIAALVDQSLVRANVDAAHGARFEMLSTIRAFAWQRLTDSPRHESVRSRHAATFVALTETSGAADGRREIVVDRIEAELDNIRAAFAWLLESGSPERVANAMGESWWFWSMRGYLAEAELWVDRCLGSAALGLEARARVLIARGNLAIWSGEYGVAVPSFLEAATIARDAGDTQTLAFADIGLGLAQGLSGSLEEGVRAIRRAIAAFEAAGDEGGAVSGVAALVWVQAITRRFDDTDDDMQRALRRAEAIDSQLDAAIIKGALAQLRMAAGSIGGIQAPLAESLEEMVASRHIASAILTLEVVAEAALSAGAGQDAICLLAATAGIRHAMGTPVPPDAAARLERLMSSGRERLGAEFDAAVARGSALDFVEAVDLGRSLVTALPRRD